MNRIAGTVDARGRSDIPEGIYDMAELGRALPEDTELDKRVAALFAKVDELRAKYKIQLFFAEDRSNIRAYKGFIVLWVTSDYDGDGDRGLYLCPQRYVDAGLERPCNAPLEPGMFLATGAVCSRCRKMTAREDLTGQIFARLPTQHWARLVTRVFGILGCNADIHLDYIRRDIRVATQEIEQRGTRDALSLARSSRQDVIYSLPRLVRDTAGGASVESVIRAFLEA